MSDSKTLRVVTFAFYSF